MKARCVMKLSHVQAILFPVTLKLGQGYPTTITPPPPGIVFTGALSFEARTVFGRIYTSHYRKKVSHIKLSLR